jgi:Domain of unknown function (DUF4291)
LKIRYFPHGQPALLKPPADEPVKIMKLPTEPYLLQRQRWPQSGRHILAHFDSESIVVYQAYRPAIGRYAAERQRFGGEFSFARMSWIKTNFLWMMYRSSWGTKPDQEVTLAIRMRRAGFNQLLREALERYAQQWLIAIDDISGFVAEQRQYTQSPATYAQLQTPSEAVYPIDDADNAWRLGLAG